MALKNHLSKLFRYAGFALFPTSDLDFADAEVSGKGFLQQGGQSLCRCVRRRKDGKIIMEEMTDVNSLRAAFKLVPVFDVSQTAGEPLTALYNVQPKIKPITS